MVPDDVDSPAPSADPAAAALTLTGDMIESMALAMLDGTPAGEAAAAWLREKKPVLIGVGVDAVKALFGSIAKQEGGLSAAYLAKVAYINTLPYDLVVVVASTSAEALQKHADGRVRLASIFDEAGKVIINIAPKLFSLALSVF